MFLYKESLLRWNESNPSRQDPNRDKMRESEETLRLLSLLE